MPWDHDADDEPGPHGTPLPPDDRLWRHPSELSPNEVRPAPARAESPRGAAWPAVVAAGLAGAVITLALLAVTDGLPTRVVEERVVEKVAMTPVVSAPIVQGARGVDAVAARVSPAIVRIEVVRDGTTSSVSGVLFRDDGLILTSAQPLQDDTGATVVLADGRRFDGEVLGADAATDIAVVHIDGQQLPVAVIGSTDGLAVGAPTVAIGAPLGADGAFVVTGVVSATGRKVNTADGRWLHGMIQTDAPITPGCLGGALVDTGGAVVGIMTSQGDDAEGDFGFATPIELAHRVASQLVEGGHAVHGWVGIAGVDLSPRRAEALGIDGGALVREVAVGGPAELAGLQAGDVITELDGTPVGSMSALVVELRDHQPGAEVLVGYWRGGRHHQTSLVVSVMP